MTINQDGNVFALVGKAQAALKKAGLQEQAKELGTKLWSMGSYEEALQLIMEYVEVE